MRLSQQILLLALVPAIAALSIEGGITAFVSSETMRDQAEERLDAVEDIRAQQLLDYLETIRKDLTLYAQNPTTKKAVKEFDEAWAELGDKPKEKLQKLYITDNPNPTGQKENLDAADDGSTYSKVHATYHPLYRRLLRAQGYYDIFLFDLDGDLVYSVYKELDYATNMNTGEWKDTDLANAFRAAVKKTDPADHSFYDFRPYKPSFGAPASFISAPIVEDGKTIGVLAFQMPVDRLNTLLSHKEGLGETGETVLVGSDFLARNDSAQVSDAILKRKFENDASRAALAGEEATGDVMVDGVEYVARYAPFEFLGVKYAFVALESAEEIYAPVNKLLIDILIEIVVIGIIVGAIGYYFGRRMSKPITEVTKIQVELASGNLDSWVPDYKSPTEVAELCNALYRLKQESRSSDRYREE